MICIHSTFYTDVEITQYDLYAQSFQTEIKKTHTKKTPHSDDKKNGIKVAQRLKHTQTTTKTPCIFSVRIKNNVSDHIPLSLSYTIQCNCFSQTTQHNVKRCAKKA